MTHESFTDTPIRITDVKAFRADKVKPDQMIWSYWEGGSVPPLINLCIQSAAFHHSNYCLLSQKEILELGWGDHLQATSGKSKLIRNALIRSLVLERFGGTWVDCDTICFSRLNVMDRLKNANAEMAFAPSSENDKLEFSPVAARAGSAEATHLLRRTLQVVHETSFADELGDRAALEEIHSEIASNQRYSIVELSAEDFATLNRHKPSELVSVKEGLLEANLGDACCLALNGIRLPLRRETFKELLTSKRVVSRLFRRVFGCVSLCGGRSMECISRLREFENPTFAEIGVYSGGNAISILEAMPSAMGLLIDPWQAPSKRYVDSGDELTRRHPNQSQWEEVYVRLLKRLIASKLIDRTGVFRLRSTQASKLIADGSLEMCFIDGEHTYEACQEDIDSWFPKVGPGGWLGGHDYDARYPEWGVIQAVDEFCEQNCLTMEIGFDYTWWVRMPT